MAAGPGSWRHRLSRNSSMQAVPRIHALAVALALAAGLPAAAAPQDARWDLQWNLRARYEHVDDAAFARDADAATLRLRAGMHASFGDHWEALVEGEAIAAAGHYDDGTGMPKPQWPAVIDPQGTDLDQAWLRGHAGPVTITAGRQRLLFGNQRWIGNSGWRQDEQTFDALSSEWQLRPSLALRYAWLDRVHRVAGGGARDPLARERRLDGHYAELAWKHGSWQLVPYALLHRDHDVAAASTVTRGVRGAYDAIANGRGCRAAAEFARQGPAGANPRDFSHDYWLLEPACMVGGVLLRAGTEHLGGDGTHALQAPLGTLHAFNGWADKFNATPAAGLDDRYLGAGGKWRAGTFEWQVAWHDYRADAGSARYGRELDASLGFPVAKGVSGLVKIADYRADAWARDMRKLWLQLEWTR
jgi:hypothetical protein